MHAPRPTQAQARADQTRADLDTKLSVLGSELARQERHWAALQADRAIHGDTQIRREAPPRFDVTSCAPVMGLRA